MAKQRGTPDQRGMGAQSDFIAEQFVPSEQFKAQRAARVRHLLALGFSAEQIAEMFSMSVDLLLDQKLTP